MLNLHKGARPDEKFHLQIGRPQIKNQWVWWKIFRFTTWNNVYTLQDHGTKKGYWWSLWLFNRLQIYWGNTKCDATRTHMYWNHQLDNDAHQVGWYVMTTTPKEMKAVRWRSKGPNKNTHPEQAYSDMGGI